MPIKTATTLDDRFNITDEEKIQVIENYMDKSGLLKVIHQEKRKNYSFRRNNEKI